MSQMAGLDKEPGSTTKNENVYFEEFVEKSVLPQTVKVTVGCAIYTDDYDLGYQTGDVITLLRVVCGDIKLTYCDPNSGCDKIISVSRDFPAKFEVLPFDPLSFDISLEHVYETVENLMVSCPFSVRANSDYVTDQTIFRAGDRLKLIRVVHRDGEKYVECKHIKDSKLIMLPLDCVGNFTPLPVTRYFTVGELVDYLPRQRRLRLAQDIINDMHPIPGLPPKFDGDVFLEAPVREVEVSYPENPGYIQRIPIDWDMWVSPRDLDYLPREEMQLQFQMSEFVKSNTKQLPLLSQVRDWEEATTTMDVHSVRPGSTLKMYALDTVQKVLATTNNKHFIIPLSYQGMFKLIPRRYNTVAELDQCQPQNQLQVVTGAPCRVDKLDSLTVGDIIQYKGRSKYTAEGAKWHEEIETVYFQQYNKSGEPIKMIEVPMYLRGQYVEILQKVDRKHFTLNEILTVRDFPMTVELINYHNNIETEDEHLPIHEEMTLTCCVMESCVITSTPQSYLFHLPIRSKLFVVFIERLNKSVAQNLKKQKWSPFNNCAEVLSYDVYTELEKDGKVYECLQQMAPPTLPRGIPTFESTVHPVKPPPRPPKKSRSHSEPSDTSPPSRPPRSTRTEADAHALNQYSKTPPRGCLISAPTSSSIQSDMPPWAPELPEPAASFAQAKGGDSDDSDDDYVDVDDNAYDDISYEQMIKKEVKVKIPDNDNLFHFTAAEMMAFFAEMKIEQVIIEKLRAAGIDGKQFSKMSNTDLSIYCIDTPLVKHFKKKTKDTRKGFLRKILPDL